MSSNKNQNFKERLENYNSPVDDSVFDRLDINREDRRVFPFYWLFGGLLVLGVIGAVIFYNWTGMDAEFNQQSSNKIASEEITENRVHQTEISNANNYNSSTGSETSLAQEGEPANNNQEKEITEIGNRNEAVSSESLQTSNTDVPDNIDVTSTLDEVNQSEPEEKRSSGSISEFSFESGKENTGNNQVSLTEDNNSAQRNTSNPNYLEETTGNGSPLVEAALDKILGREFKVDYQKDVQELQGPECPRILKYDKYFSELEVFGGLGKSFRSLSKNNSYPESTGYLELREGSETPLMNYNFGALYRLSHVKSGLSLATGAEYSILEERFSYRSRLEKMTTIKDVYDNQGNLIGTDTVMVTGYRQKTTYNRFHSLGIPVLLGYSKHYNNFFIRVELGGKVDLWQKRRGEILSLSRDFYSLSEDSKSYYYDGITFTAKARLSAGIVINPGLIITVSPAFDYIINPITTENSPISAEYSKLSGNIGLIIPLSND